MNELLKQMLFSVQPLALGLQHIQNEKAKPLKDSTLLFQVTYFPVIFFSAVKMTKLLIFFFIFLPQ